MWRLAEMARTAAWKPGWPGPRGECRRGLAERREAMRRRRREGSAGRASGMSARMVWKAWRRPLSREAMISTRLGGTSTRAASEADAESGLEEDEDEDDEEEEIEV